MKYSLIDKAIYEMEREKRNKERELAWQERQKKYKEKEMGR